MDMGKEDVNLNGLSSLVGDISVGREHLGEYLPLAVSRMMTTTIKDALAEEYGREAEIKIMRKAGEKAGLIFCEKVLDAKLDPGAFFDKLIDIFREWKIGLIRVEKSNDDFSEITISIAEDMYCAGLPVLGEVVCNFEEGLLEGIFGFYFGGAYTAREIDCWATGQRVCRFRVSRIEKQ